MDPTFHLKNINVLVDVDGLNSRLLSNMSIDNYEYLIES